MEQTRDQSVMSEQNRLFKGVKAYLLLDALEAGVLVWYLLSTPADPKNVVALGYSLPQLITIAGFILVFLVCLYAAYKIYQNATLVVQLFEKLFSRQSQLWLIFFAVNFLFLFGMMYILTSPSSARELKFFYDTFHLKPIAVFLIYIAPTSKYALPVVTWITLVSAQTIIGLLYIYAEYFKQAIQADFARPRARILITLASLAVLSILAIGFSRALPYLIMPDKTQGLFLANNINMIYLHRYIWALALYFNLGAAWLWYIKLHDQENKGNGASHSYRFFLPFNAALLVSYFWLTVIMAGEVGDNHSPSNWDVFYVSPDSGGYITRYSAQSIRPPVYPLFIQLATTGTGFNHNIQGYQHNQPIEDITNPLIRVTRAQKAVLLATSLLACAALMGLMNSPLPALLFLGLYEFGFFSQEIDFILSEPLAQAWLFLILATFFAFLWKQWKLLLSLGGVFCAALYLTRPAGVYGGVILAAMLLWALFHDWRKYWLTCLSAVILPAILVALPIFYTYTNTGSLTPAPMYAHAKVAFALQVARPQDIDLMPDEKAREFLATALDEKAIEDAKIKAANPDVNEQVLNMLSSNIFQVAFPLASEMLPNISERSQLLIKVSTLLLAQHRLEYYLLGWNSFRYATTRMSMGRIIAYPYSFWITVFICLGVALFLRGWVGFCSVSLILSHLAHLVIVSLFDFPNTRYIWATEFLIFLALFILVLGLTQRVSTTRCVSRKHESI